MIFLDVIFSYFCYNIKTTPRRYQNVKKNLIAGQSGGPTAAINSSLYGVVSEALKHTEEIDHVYGMVNGIEDFKRNSP